jgi:hypothetical protein
MPLLPQPESAPQAAPGEPMAEPPAVVLNGGTLVDDLCTVLAYLQNEEVVGPLDALTKRSGREFGKQLGSRPGRNQRVRLDPSRVRPFLSASRGQQLQKLAEGWQADTEWNDQILSLSDVALSIAMTEGHYPDAPLLARQAILALMAQIPHGMWWSLDSLVEAMKDRSPDFQRPAGDYDSWLIRDDDTGEYLRGFEHWDRVEGALIRYVVRRPLFWLGIVDLGLDRDVDNTWPPAGSFRLTPSGRAFLRGEAWSPGPEPEKLRIQPDGTLEVPRTVNAYERFTAARFTDWLPQDFGSLSRLPKPEMVYRYRITGGSLARARAQGVAVRHVLGFLGKASVNPVPQQIAGALERWERDGAQVELADRVVLRVNSVEVLERLRASPKTRGYLGEALGPLAVEIRRSDLDKLHAAMLEIGLLADGLWRIANGG